MAASLSIWAGEAGIAGELLNVAGVLLGSEAATADYAAGSSRDGSSFFTLLTLVLIG
jgi:hypothetical protein